MLVAASRPGLESTSATAPIAIRSTAVIRLACAASTAVIAHDGDERDSLTG
jgi:hypothetical protein